MFCSLVLRNCLVAFLLRDIFCYAPLSMEWYFQFWFSCLWQYCCRNRWHIAEIVQILLTCIPKKNCKHANYVWFSALIHYSILMVRSFQAKGASVGDIFLASDVAFHDRRIPIPVSVSLVSFYCSSFLWNQHQPYEACFAAFNCLHDHYFILSISFQFKPNYCEF